MKTSAPVRRTAEIEEITNLYFVHPLAARLVPLFARLHLTPNVVSLTGMLFGILAGFAYYHYPALSLTLSGFVLMVAWHVMDGADGQLARYLHVQSHFGKVLDGISDNVTFLAVYVALAMALSRRYGDEMYLLVLLSGVCHAVQSASYEVQRQEYELWGWGRKAQEAPERETSRAPRLKLFALLDRLFYGRLAFPVLGVTRVFHAQMSAALDRVPQRAEFIRERYRETFASLTRQWSVLSANYRTLGIFVAALCGAPQYYFAFEILGFSALLALMIYRQGARNRRFLDTLDTATALPVP